MEFLLSFPGTDEDTIIEIICRRSHDQLLEIDNIYQQLYGRLLKDDIKDDLSGYFEKLILALFMNEAEHDAATIKEAVDVSTTNFVHCKSFSSWNSVLP